MPSPVAEEVVCPLFHRYEKAGVPPDAVMVPIPLFPPKQETLFCEIAAVTAGNSVMVTEDVVVHPFESVTVTEKFPAASPATAEVDCPLLQRNVYGVVPPLGVTNAVPLPEPLQALDCEAVEERSVGCVMENVLVAVHPLESVTVTE